MTTVRIRGDSVAAYCCAHLLNQAGFQMILAPAVRPRLPAIMLSDHALALIRDVFANQNLFLDAPRIRTRMVAWGPDSKLLAVDHSGVVVSEEVLLTALE